MDTAAQRSLPRTRQGVTFASLSVLPAGISHHIHPGQILALPASPMGNPSHADGTGHLDTDHILKAFYKTQLRTQYCDTRRGKTV